MSDSELREAKIADELEVGLRDSSALRRMAREAVKAKQFVKAAMIFAGLARATREDPDLALHAAQNYEKGEARDDALRWFLESSERYARQNHPTKAIATLRLYHKMAPDEHEGPKRVFHLCRDMDGFRDRFVELLSPKEQAGHHLRFQDVFATFDDDTFDDMLDAMHLRLLKAGDTLVRKGDEATSLFVVVEGRLDGYLELDGVRTKLGSIQPGDICGEIGYFLDGKRTAEVVAAEGSSVLELAYSKLDELRDKAPDFSGRLDHLYQARMLANQLAVTDFFSELSVPLRNEIAGRMQPFLLRKEAALFDENDTTQDVYVIQSGEIAVYIRLGKERLLKNISTGSVIGEFSVMLGGRRIATPRALDDCKLMRLSGDDYQALFEAHPELRERLAERKSKHMAETREFILNMDEGISEQICTAMLRMIWGSS